MGVLIAAAGTFLHLYLHSNADRKQVGVASNKLHLLMQLRRWEKMLKG